MALQDYLKAQKLGEKRYRTAIAHGDYPFLPSLEEILRKKRENEDMNEEASATEPEETTAEEIPAEEQTEEEIEAAEKAKTEKEEKEKAKDVEGQLPMGQMEIPLSMIAGTVQSDRTSAFASNFMPLLSPDTEFCSKWSQLCDSVREMGVNEPIVVYEFMQRFYIAEGNKRVSVSRYFGAVSINAIVTRLVPRRTDTDEYRIYSEFVNFHRVSGIYEIQMTQPGAFTRLLQAITPFELPNDADEKTLLPEPWDEDLRRDVKFMYSVFENYYNSKIGGRLPVTPGDAFLHFLEIYGFPQLHGLSSVELQRRIERIRGEFRVLGNVNPTSHILNPTEGSQKVALAKMILPIGSGTLRIAFLYPKDPQNSGWTYNHELGRRYIQDAFGDQIETAAYVCPAEDAEETIARAIADGCKLIFTTSPVYHACSMHMAVEHPEVIILNCSVNTAYQQLRTYYLRIYEAKFITGIIAGSMTENGKVGYIADYPVLGTPASIGAFALGVKLVNPRAMVYLDWSTLENHDPIAYFRGKQIDLISDRDINAPLSEEAGFGLYGIYGDVSFRLAVPVWNWGSLYEDLVRSVLIGAWKNDANQNETQALNYYWGMSSGAIDVACSSHLPSGTQKLVQLVQKQLTLEKFQPFSGLIYGQDGKCRVRSCQSLTPDEIITADWLPDNVVGRLPEVSELAPQFREFAKWHSIHNQHP